jgi:hypothetical protein
LPRYARPFVALFLTALVVCPLAAVNGWPMSSWRLFSALRSDRQTSWQAVAVDSSGDEHDFPVASMPRGYLGFRRIMAGFSRRPAGGRDAICGVWLQGATQRFGETTTLLRIYHLSWLVSDREGDRAAPPQRALAWTCSSKGARVAG